MLPGGYSAVMQARSREEFRDEVVRFARGLGFDLVSAMTVVDHGLNRSEFFVVDNTPAGYLEAADDPARNRHDPVMQHCKRQTVPIIWNQHTYVAQGAGEMWEQMAPFGYHTGIALALHMPEGRHFQLGVDRDQALPEDPRELQRLVADLQLFAVHAQEAALRIYLPRAMQQERPALTPRELEALRWTMDHVAEFGGDHRRIIVMGHSAGAHIAAMLAFDRKWLAKVSLDAGIDLIAMIGLAGPYDFLPLHSETLKEIFGPEERLVTTQPINFVEKGAPPAFLATGRNDRTVDPGNSIRLAERIRLFGGESRVKLYDRVNHRTLIGALARPLRFLAPVLDDVVGFAVERSCREALPHWTAAQGRTA